MASTKVTFVTGTAEVKRRDPNRASNSQPLEEHLTTEPSTPLQVNYVDGKCTCCPYGYHIDLDFLNFCRDVESGSTLRNLKRIQRAKRKLRKSMEIMLDEQEGIAADPNSAPPDVVHSTEAGRLMHMINYERSATHRILSQIDSSVNTTIATIDGGRGRRYMSSDSDEPVTPNVPIRSAPTTTYEDTMPSPFSTSARTDSLSSLSSVSTVSSEAPMMYQAQLMQQQQHQHYQHLATSKTTTKVIENPVLEMATAEMKHYSTHSSAQLANNVIEEPDIYSPVEKPIRPLKTPPPTTPRASPDVNQMSLQSVREAMVVSLQRLRELEEQVKAIPILQVRISVLKEEKRLLNLQLKASKATNKPVTRGIGCQTDMSHIQERMDISVVSPKQVELPKSFSPIASLPSSKSPVVRSPPPTFPKPVRTVSVGVGDHSVVDPYLLQPNLSSGFTIRENETHSEIHTTMFVERDLRQNRIRAPSLNMSFQQSSLEERELRQPTSSHAEVNQPVFTINQIQRSSPKALTRTVGVGEGNVFEGSGLHVHEKEFRTVFIGQNSGVAKRNVGIECRVPTRDVGVSFRCDEEKPETRTIGVNVSCDTSGIHTSLDFKGEQELRVALRDVLQRNVRSIGTNCSFKPVSRDVGIGTTAWSGVTVGCGDEDHRTDVEIRYPTVRKSVGVFAKPDTGNKCISTETGWALDAGTNTVPIDKYHKASMTDKQRLAFAATNTEPAHTRQTANQTEVKMFIAMEQLKHLGSNTQKISTYSTSSSTDILPTFNVGVNTTEKVSDLFREAQEQKSVVTTTEVKSIERKPRMVDRGVGDESIDEAYSFSETTEISRPFQVISPVRKSLSVEEKILQKGASQATAFLSNKSSTDDSNEDNRSQFSSYEITRRSSAPVAKSFKSSQEELMHRSSSQEDLDKRNSAFDRVSPSKGEEGFSETIVEHFIITKDGKQLISEEKTRSSSSGTNTSFRRISDGVRDGESSWSKQSANMSGLSRSSSDNNSSNIGSGSREYGGTSSSYISDNGLGSSSYSSNSVLSGSGGLNSVGYSQTSSYSAGSGLGSGGHSSGGGLSSDGYSSGGALSSGNRSGSSLYSSSYSSSSGVHSGSYGGGGGGDLSSGNSNTGGLSSDGFSSGGVLSSSSYSSDGGFSSGNYGSGAGLSSSSSQTMSQVGGSSFSSGMDALDGNSGLSSGVRQAGERGTNSRLGESSTRLEKNYTTVVTNPYKTVANLAEVSSMADSDNTSRLQQISKTSSEGNLFKEKIRSKTDNTELLDMAYDMRRAGSVEDFMPDDIRKYMSIDPSVSKDSGFGEDLLQRFSEASSPATASSSSSEKGGGMKSVKLSKTVTTKRTTRSGDKVVVHETKTVEGPDGSTTTTYIETDSDGHQVIKGGAGEATQQGGSSSGTTEAGISQGSASSSSFSSGVHSGGSDGNISEGHFSHESQISSFSSNGAKSYSETTMSTVGDSAEDDGQTDLGTYGSLDRRTGKLRSIMKHSKSEEEKMSGRKGITFAESVTGGTGSSSDDGNTTDSDSTTSFEEGSYDSQQGQVVYRCKDDEAIAQGLPGAQMFDQNIRETYELTSEMSEACNVLATYLMDSTTIQTKQLNASLNTIQQEWFRVSSHKLSSPHQVEDYLSSINEISKRLLENIVNMADANGNTAIHYCISHCNFEIASLLLDSEVCDINKQNKAGYTPIMLGGLATVQNAEQRNSVRRLFAAGDINARAIATQQTALMLAASHGRTEMVQMLVEEGADVNLQDVDGSTALMCACEHGHLDIVNFLLSQPNIDANLTDNENSTALTIAMEADHKDVGVVLYKHVNFSKPSSPGYHKKRKSSSSPTPSTFVIR